MISSGTTTTISSGTYTTPSSGWGCSGGFHKVWINLDLPGSTITVPANAILKLSVSSSMGPGVKVDLEEIAGA